MNSTKTTVGIYMNSFKTTVGIYMTPTIKLIKPVYQRIANHRAVA